MSFLFDGQKYEYFRHQYNGAWSNERSVEVPIVYSAVLNALGRKILEVGDVLQHYYHFPHDILDKYEVNTGVINEDVLDFQPAYPYDLIVSISTLEHVGYDSYHGKEEKDPDKVLRAIRKIRSWLSPYGIGVITFPLGYNPHLDDHWKAGRLGFMQEYYMRLVKPAVGTWESGAHPIWEQAAREELVIHKPYDGARDLLIGVLRP